MNEFPFANVVLMAAFVLAAGATLAGALIAALSTRIVRGVGGLMICCLGLAGLFYFLQSPFVALMEILIYVGAVCITIVFGVMLSEPDEDRGPESRPQALRRNATAATVSGTVFLSLTWLGLTADWPARPGAPADGSVEAIGVSLLTTYSMAFELISLVLLVAIVGALVIARPGRSRP